MSNERHGESIKKIYSSTSIRISNPIAFALIYFSSLFRFNSGLDVHPWQGEVHMDLELELDHSEPHSQKSEGVKGNTSVIDIICFGSCWQKTLKS